MAHALFCSLPYGAIERTTQVEIDHLRSRIDAFFANDSKQVTPLYPVRRVQFAEEALPATTARSLDSVSSSMLPSVAAQWYFCNVDLSPELEVVSRTPEDEGGFSGVYKGKWMNHDVAVKRITSHGRDRSTTWAPVSPAVLSGL